MSTYKAMIGRVVLTVLGMLYLPVMVLCADGWTMERVGQRDIGFVWTAPLQIGDYWLVGSSNGTVVKLSDAAKEIEQYDIGTCSDIVAIAKAGTTILVGCMDGTIHQSTDGGVTWSSLTDIEDVITAMVGLDDNSVVACSDNGVVYLIDLVKGNQRPLYSEAGIQFRGLDYHQGELTAIGRRGVMVHTTDRGESWQRTPFDSTDDFAACYRVNDSILVLSCYKTQVLLTTNNGRLVKARKKIKSYSSQKLREADALSCVSHLGNRVYCTGFITPIYDERHFNLYWTDDWGTTWDSSAYYLHGMTASTIHPQALCLDADSTMRLYISDPERCVMLSCVHLETSDTLHPDTMVLGAPSRYYARYGSPELVQQCLVAADTSDGILYGLQQWRYAVGNEVAETELVRSTNKEETWEEIATMPSTCWSIAVAGSSILVSADSGSVYLSTDWGSSFSERMFVDTAFKTNFLAIEGGIVGGEFVLFSSVRRSSDSGKRNGKIMTLNKLGEITVCPLPNDAHNDVVTKPFVRHNTVYSMYHVTDTNWIPQTSHIIAWDVTANQIHTTDITDLIKTDVGYGATILFVDDTSIWIGLRSTVVRYNPSTHQVASIDGLRFNPMMTAPIMKLVVDHGVGVCVNEFGVKVSSTPYATWYELDRCGSVKQNILRLSSFTCLGNNQYFAGGIRYNYLITGPGVPSDVPEHRAESPQHEARAVVVGTMVDVGAINASEASATDINGRCFALSVYPEGDHSYIATTGLTPGVYHVSAISDSGETQMTILVLSSW